MSNQFTSQWYEAKLAKQNRAGGQRNRACAEQKEQALRSGKGSAVDGHQDKSLDESMHSEFRVSIILRMSDERVRDCDGALATLLDCLITARRQLEGYIGGGGKGGTRAEGARGGGSDD